ncbi:MAG: hypothetical protein Pg6A_05320 [Termitinemataceae bacterium]|nr:MAG: hypothetical protein Pg6A_05320 [Termitinemataceae bacterium]
MTIGFIGLGIMGGPMAKNLIKGGYKLIVPAKSGKAPELRAVFFDWMFFRYFEQCLPRSFKLLNLFLAETKGSLSLLRVKLQQREAVLF